MHDANQIIIIKVVKDHIDGFCVRTVVMGCMGTGQMRHRIAFIRTFIG